MVESHLAVKNFTPNQPIIQISDVLPMIGMMLHERIIVEILKSFIINRPGTRLIKSCEVASKRFESGRLYSIRSSNWIHDEKNYKRMLISAPNTKTGSQYV